MATDPSSTPNKPPASQPAPELFAPFPEPVAWALKWDSTALRLASRRAPAGSKRQHNAQS